MKARNLRENSDDELRELCEEKQRALSDFRVKGVIGESVENPTQERLFRRDIARIKTVINERTAKREMN